MLPGDYDHSADVRELDTYAVVNGVSRQVESVSLDAELMGDLPDQVVSGGGISGRTGTIVWSTAEDVQVREVSPWHKPVGWPPSAGDRVQVYVTDGTTSYPRFTGVIDKTEGTVGGRMESRIIDFRDRLNGTFTHEALLRHHVPYSEGDDYRSIGLGFWYPLVMALRSVRVFNTPPMIAEIAVSAPLQRSVWAEAGTVTHALGLTSGNHANFYRAPWGYSSGGFNVRYRPRTSYPPSQPLQVTLMVADDHSGNATVDVNYGDNYTVRFSVLSSRTVVAYRAGEEICRLTSGQMEGATIVTLLVKDGAWTLRNDRGREATGGRGPGSSAAMSTVQFNAAEGARVAGMQVSRPNTTAHEFNSLGFTPSMSFEAGGLGASMDMMPRLENRNVADVVDEICKATLTAAWWDESGMLRFVQSDRLRGADPVQTVTTLDDITELQWEDSLLSVRSRVHVDWKSPSISRGRYMRKELFRGSGDSMEATDIIEVYATPDNDTEWLGVDRAVRRLNDANWGIYNRKRGSFMGAYFLSSYNDEELPTSGQAFSMSTENLGTAAVKIIHTAGSLGTGVEANLGTSENATALRAVLRGDNLPVIRGFGEGKWVDETYTSPTTGPTNLPELTHDLGYWGHEILESDSVARRIGDYIASMVTTPSPTIRNLAVMYDPRRQLGDVITIEAGILDVTLRALIVGISESHQTGQHTQQLTVRIIRADSTRRVTYDELAQAWDGGDYNALQAVWAGLTYTDFTRTPLEGAPNA